MYRTVAFCATVFVATVATAQDFQSETVRINAFFEQVFEDRVDRSPMFQSYLGIKDEYGEWDDLSEAAGTEELAHTVDALARMRSEFDYDQLDDQAKLSYRLFEHNAENEINGYRWRYHYYPVNQMFGIQSRIPAFLINIHRVTSVDDARAYISRLNGIDEMFDQVMDDLAVQREMGVIPPKFVFELVLEGSRNVISGKPFEKRGDDSSLLADFKEKVNALDIDRKQKQALITLAEEALVSSVQPAYEELIGVLEEMEQEATTDDGVWKLPDGEDYYEARLRYSTTTDMTAQEVHDLGLKEVARIHDEMRAIMDQVEFEGTLQEFFEFMRTDEQFYYETTEGDKQKYLEEAKAIIDDLRGKLDDLFVTKPEADMIVKPVEEFREKSAGKAFYQSPAPDGSRPGTYYVNFYDMREMPTYQMQALAYHEGIPGHHMQLSIAQELDNIPTFRKYEDHTAYVEGWGLYSEYLPKEFGFYTDPYADFGRLAMELWRAARLVVDTGIHYKRWTRQEAIDYLLENTPNPEGDCVRSINRYIVMPGQACAYKIGQLKILELREHAKEQLGDDFDIREYHSVILDSGSMPLTILEEHVENWIEEKKAQN